jgi:hypothetical protein
MFLFQNQNSKYIAFNYEKMDLEFLVIERFIQFKAIQTLLKYYEMANIRLFKMNS